VEARLGSRLTRRLTSELEELREAIDAELEARSRVPDAGSRL
jgi:hypothetical protein